MSATRSVTRAKPAAHSHKTENKLFLVVEEAGRLCSLAAAACFLCPPAQRSSAAAVTSEDCWAVFNTGVFSQSKVGSLRLLRFLFAFSFNLESEKGAVLFEVKIAISLDTKSVIIQQVYNVGFRIMCCDSKHFPVTVVFFNADREVIHVCALRKSSGDSLLCDDNCFPIKIKELLKVCDGDVFFNVFLGIFQRCAMFESVISDLFNLYFAEEQ